MHYACEVVENLGPNFKNEIVGTTCGFVLNGYMKTFDEE